MQWIAPSEKDTATDTLEKRVWAAADQFRANSGLSAAQYSQPVLGVKLDPAHPESFFWLFHTLKERGLRDVVGGTAQPQITPDGISSIDLLTPPLPIITRFQQAVDAMFKQAWTLDGQVQILLRTRELLLPRLLSGQMELTIEDVSA